jgi:hypothetical protein
MVFHPGYAAAALSMSAIWYGLSSATCRLYQACLLRVTSRHHGMPAPLPVYSFKRPTAPGGESVNQPDGVWKGS